MQCTTLCTAGMTAMTKDDVIRMAIKCQLVNAGNREGLYMNALSEFADLAFAAGAAAERNVLKDRIDTLQKLYKQAIRQRDELMNEQRAQVAAIRARGQL